MGHANINDHADWLGPDDATLRGDITFGADDTEALLFAQVCQSITHDDNTVAREVETVRVTPPQDRWEVVVKRRGGPQLTQGPAFASVLAVFTNEEHELASYSWSDCVHLEEPGAAA